MGVGIGALTGGIINGGIAAANGRNFWNGSFPQSQTIPTQTLPLKPLETKNNSLEIARQEIKQAVPDYGPINYKTSYYHKVIGTDGQHYNIPHL